MIDVENMNPNRLLSAKEASEIFGFPESYARHLLIKRRVASQRKGRQLAARLMDWERFIDKRAEDAKL